MQRAGAEAEAELAELRALTQQQYDQLQQQQAAADAATADVQQQAQRETQQMHAELEPLRAEVSLLRAEAAELRAARGHLEAEAAVLRRRSEEQERHAEHGRVELEAKHAMALEMLAVATLDCEAHAAARREAQLRAQVLEREYEKLWLKVSPFIGE